MPPLNVWSRPATDPNPSPFGKVAWVDSSVACDIRVPVDVHGDPEGGVLAGAADVAVVDEVRSHRGLFGTGLSFATKASRAPLKVRSGPSITGNVAWLDLVCPVTYRERSALCLLG